jgi:hypothetical protein
MSQMGHSRPGRTSSISSHVRYASDRYPNGKALKPTRVGPIARTARRFSRLILENLGIADVAAQCVHALVARLIGHAEPDCPSQSPRICPSSSRSRLESTWGPACDGLVTLSGQQMPTVINLRGL